MGRFVTEDPASHQVKIGRGLVTTETDTPAYLRTWADEISARANRVRHLIGDAHWPSDGSYKEFLLRELLVRHLPGFLNIGRGFIRPIHRSDGCSPEIDLLISDPTAHVPLFREGDLQIVPPSSAIAAIEVKSTYSTANLRDALTNAIRTRISLIDDIEIQRVWSSVVFINPGKMFDPAKLLESLIGILKDESFWQALRETDALPSASLLPNSIAITGGALAMIAPAQTGNDSAHIRVFETPELATALALAQVFAHAQAILKPNGLSAELDDILRNFDAGSLLRHQEVLLPNVRNDG